MLYLGEIVPGITCRPRKPSLVGRPLDLLRTFLALLNAQLVRRSPGQYVRYFGGRIATSGRVFVPVHTVADTHDSRAPCL